MPMKAFLPDRVMGLWNEGLDAEQIRIQIGHKTRSTIYAILASKGISARLQYRPFHFEPLPSIQVDPIWAAEFRGFFYGEGCAQIVLVHRNRNQEAKFPRFYPVMVIGERADETPYLESIQVLLGGRIYHARKWTLRNGKRCAPKVYWYCQGWSLCKVVIEGVFLGHPTSCHKGQDVNLLYEAVLARGQMTYQLTEEERAILADYRQRLSDIKSFKEHGR